MAWALRRLGQHNELPKRPPPLVARHTHRRIRAELPQRRAGSVLVRAWFCFGSALVRSGFAISRFTSRSRREWARPRAGVVVLFWFGSGSVLVRSWFGKSCSSASGLYRRSMSTDEFVTRPRSPVRDASRADAVGASQPISAVGKPLSAASDLHRRSRGIQVTRTHLAGCPLCWIRTTAGPDLRASHLPGLPARRHTACGFRDRSCRAD